jgi:hypothetical protein
VAIGKWTATTARSCITRNKGTIAGKQIGFNKGWPGLKVLGAVDYLVNHCGFTWIRA